jgi:hypothetical protein
MAGTTIAASLSTLLGGLSPIQLGKLGNHLTQSSEMQALQIVDTMQMNPSIAPMLLPSLSSIPNMPPEVTTWVTAAITNPAEFQQNMTQAKAALQVKAVAPGLLGNLGL